MKGKVGGIAVTVGIVLLLNGLSWAFDWGWMFY